MYADEAVNVLCYMIIVQLLLLNITIDIIAFQWETVRNCASVKLEVSNKVLTNFYGQNFAGQMIVQSCSPQL